MTFIPPPLPVPAYVSHIEQPENIVQAAQSDTSDNYQVEISGAGDTLDNARANAMVNLKKYFPQWQDMKTTTLMSESYKDGVYHATMEFQGASHVNNSIVVLPGKEDTNTAPPPPVSWIFLIPAERMNDGSVHWGRESEWSQAWLPPSIIDNVKIVSTLGDAQDHKWLTTELLSNGDEQHINGALSEISKKYHAPAIALAIRDHDGTVNVSFWRPNVIAMAQGVTNAEQSNSKNGVLDLINKMSSGQTSYEDVGEELGPNMLLATDSANQRQSDTTKEVDVEQSPEFGSGKNMGYSVVMASSNKELIEETSRIVVNIQNFNPILVNKDDDGFEISGSYNGTQQEFEAQLKSRGVKVTKY